MIRELVTAYHSCGNLTKAAVNPLIGICLGDEANDDERQLAFRVIEEALFPDMPPGYLDGFPDLRRLRDAMGFSDDASLSAMFPPENQTNTHADKNRQTADAASKYPCRFVIEGIHFDYDEMEIYYVWRWAGTFK